MRDKLPVQWLIEMYTRTDRFAACLRLLLAHGAQLDDPVVAPVLLDDATGLATALAVEARLLQHRTTLVSAFTPLIGASLLHVAAEYGQINALRVLLKAGADVDVRSAVDEHGLGGQTPLFHTVNSSRNRSAEAMRLLLDAGARVDMLLPGLIWGKGFEWETTVFDVTPIGYAQLGLLPQMHREERDVYDTIRRLLAAGERQEPPLPNVPNRYLRPSGNRVRE